MMVVLPQEVFNIAAKLGLLGPAVVFDGLTDVALDIRCHGAGAVVVLVVTFAGINMDEMVLDGTLDTTRHIVVDGGEADRHTDGLILAE